MSDNPTELEIIALAECGKAERDRGHLAEAQVHYADALVLSRSQDSPLRTAHIARHLGDIYREMGFAEKAEQLLTEAISLYRQNLGTKVLDLANAIRPLALLKAEQGDAVSARQLWQEARVLYSAVEVEAGMVECSEHLAKLSRTA